MRNRERMTAALNLAGTGWTRCGTTMARGQAYRGDGKLMRALDLAAHFERLTGSESWGAAAAALNGSFAAACARGGDSYAVVDRLRTIPLFFAKSTNGLIIGDVAHVVASSAGLPRRIVQEAADEFRLTGYVTGSRTLIAGVDQIPAGHTLRSVAGPGTIQTLAPYYSFRHRSSENADSETLIGELVGLHERVFRRLLGDIGDRPIALPLSGGHDSRLIGLMLRDLGCRNVLCYTYGAPGNWESRISSELAKHLGFRWTMVPYTASDWRRWGQTPEFQAYFRSAGNCVSVPHIQDWPAVYELTRRGEIAKDAVFVPGHSGDFLAGSHIPKWYPDSATLSREQFLRSLFDAHYSLWDWPASDAARLRELFGRHIEEVVGPIGRATPDEAADRFEYWDCQERQAKFIVNSVRVYESFGFEWRLPLFDAELMDFWSRVPLLQRVDRRLYFEFAARYQTLPITPANTDRSAFLASAIGMVDRLHMRPLAKRALRVWMRMRKRHAYERSPMAWFALIDLDEFRRRYTGREIGHAFFALKYLEAIAE